MNKPPLLDSRASTNALEDPFEKLRICVNKTFGNKGGGEGFLDPLIYSLVSTTIRLLCEHFISLSYVSFLFSGGK